MTAPNSFCKVVRNKAAILTEAAEVVEHADRV